MTMQLFIYLACAATGLVFHWIFKGKSEPTRPSAVSWAANNYGYIATSIGLTAVSALFFMPAMLGPDAYAAALGFGVSGGSIAKSILPKK